MERLTMLFASVGIMLGIVLMLYGNFAVGTPAVLCGCFAIFGIGFRNGWRNRS